MTEIHPFWEEEDVVERFAARDADHRLRTLLEAEGDPGSLRVLDVGCAGGRNTELAAQAGCDVRAVDLSAAMVRATRARLAPLLGPDAAADRVTRGRMDDLSAFADGSFDLVLALGIFQNATSLESWRRALGESARVLTADGRLLVAHFAPGTDLTGDGAWPQAHLELDDEGPPDSPRIWDGFSAGPMVLATADQLDRALGRLGLVPLVPTETVDVEVPDGGRRVTVNGLYRKSGVVPER